MTDWADQALIAACAAEVAHADPYRNVPVRPSCAERDRLARVVRVRPEKSAIRAFWAAASTGFLGWLARAWHRGVGHGAVSLSNPSGPCQCHRELSDCAEAPNCRWLARMRRAAATTASPPEVLDMPIRPENKHRYPKDWPAIRAAILVRAGHRCEHPDCGVPNYAVGWWRATPGGQHVWTPLTGPGDGGTPGPALQPRNYMHALELMAEHADCEWRPLTVIVLTVAHLDHTPENCAPENLRAWCQRHHLAYDAHHHRCAGYATRKALARTVDMFKGLPS